MTLPDRDAARDWIGRTVVDREGAELGVCAALLADEATGLPEWMYAERDEVTVVVPLLDATGSGNRVQVTVTRAEVDGAPRFGPGRELSQDQEAVLYRHYGIEYSTDTSESLLPATEAEPVTTGPTAGGSTAPAAESSAPETPAPETPAPETPAPETPAPEAAVSRPAGSAPDAATDRPVASGSARGPGVAAAVAVLAALAAAVAAVRLRRGMPLGPLRVLRRQAPPPRSAARRAVVGAAAARERAVQVAASAGPLVEASGRLALSGASAGAEVARACTDAATARLAPLVAATGQTAWRAARTGTDSALRATDALASAVAAAVPRVADSAARAGRTGLRAVLTAGAAAAAVPEVVSETGERLEKGWRKVMGRVSLGLGLGVGYVLGARAGRARYEQIKQAAAGVVERPEVQQALEQVRAAAPAPLQSSIDRLAGRGPGRHSAEATGTVGTPSAPVSGTGAPRVTDAPLPDPLIPPAKSDIDPTGRS